MTNKPEFVHLQLHSEYSLVDGIVKIKKLIEKTKAQAMFAVALTDVCNLFAVVKFYRAAIAAGIKPIFGSDILIENPQNNAEPHSLTLLCQNKQGYANLTRLISKAYIEGQKSGQPLVRFDWLAEYAPGLIAIASADCVDYHHLFPECFYLQVQRIGHTDDDDKITRTLALAIELNLPLVATNAVRFLEAEDFPAHEARVCIHDGVTLIDPRRRKKFTPQQYLRSAVEMAELFADIPQALLNSVEIAKRCNVQLDLGTPYLPDFPIPANITIDAYLQQSASAGLTERCQSKQPTDEGRKTYVDRLNTELRVINDMGFAGYFLIVADFIQWAKDNKIPVGPGRGSGAGSLVAYALKITDIDPLEYDLLFERFLNPERVSMPDFDIDFCMEGRDRVIDYVAEKYGRGSVSQIITFGTMAAKAVVRDVGRVLSHPYGFVDKVAKAIPFELGITLDKALQQEEDLRKRYDDEEEVRELIDLAKKLEGVTRNAGKHAGGVVIAPSQLTDFAALYCDPGSGHIVTQLDKDDVEAVGLVKFDFLGLRTLTIINNAVQIINAQRQKMGEALIDIQQIPTDDEATFALLKACNTTAIFQLESRGMKDLIHRLQPDKFEEIIALVALFRPGPLQSGMVDDFINRKHGRAKVLYPHPDLEDILQPTYGVILYQEQVMQIAQVLAGYTLGAADILRRAMGKKKPEEMAKQRQIFIEGALARGVDETTASSIFDLMEKFAGYGFNKSHSAAYALLSYQTAWLKTHYPAAFMAAVLSADMDNTAKVVTLIEDTRAMGITVRPPCINQGDYRFTLRDEKTIIYGLGAIKGLGEAAIENIIEMRSEQTPYADLFDFCERVDLRKINKRSLEALVRSGAMDVFAVHRASLFASLEKATKLAAILNQNQQTGQISLFTNAVDNSAQYLEATPWSDKQRLEGEKETLGFYLSGHPLDQYQNEIRHMNVQKISAIVARNKQTIKLVGMIANMRTMLTKKNDRMAFITLDDGTGRIEIAVFADSFAEHKTLFDKDNILLIEGEVSTDDYTGGLRMRASHLQSMSQYRREHVKHLLLSANEPDIDNSLLIKLKSIFEHYQPGHCPVHLQLQIQQVQVTLKLGEDWQVETSDELKAELAHAAQFKSIEWIY